MEQDEFDGFGLFGLFRRGGLMLFFHRTAVPKKSKDLRCRRCCLGLGCCWVLEEEVGGWGDPSILFSLWVINSRQVVGVEMKKDWIFTVKKMDWEREWRDHKDRPTRSRIVWDDDGFRIGFYVGNIMKGNYKKDRNKNGGDSSGSSRETRLCSDYSTRESQKYLNPK